MIEVNSAAATIGAPSTAVRKRGGRRAARRRRANCRDGKDADEFWLIFYSIDCHEGVWASAEARMRFHSGLGRPMRKLAFLAAAALAATPLNATVVIPGDGIGGPGATIDLFDSSTRGTLLAYSQTTGPALTFAAMFASAVYRNTSGTLDFYFQVARTGDGSASGNAIQSFTAADFGGYDVFAFRDGSDFDGAGGFLAAGNPGTFTSTASRSFDGEVLGVNFGSNNLAGTENTTTYIFRTDALNFTTGTFGVIDGSTLQGVTFAPFGDPFGSVPEPATWAMMLAGFGLCGAALRRKRKAKLAFGSI
jgi:hypothetical protein